MSIDPTIGRQTERPADYNKNADNKDYSLWIHKGVDPWIICSLFSAVWLPVPGRIHSIYVSTTVLVLSLETNSWCSVSGSVWPCCTSVDLMLSLLFLLGRGEGQCVLGCICVCTQRGSHCLCVWCWHGCPPKKRPVCGQVYDGGMFIIHRLGTQIYIFIFPK